MTRWKWTTDEQEEWLEQRKPAFLEANQKKTAVKDFFPTVVEEFCQKWPVPPVKEQEIADAGSVELAKRVKQNKYDKVNNSCACSQGKRWLTDEHSAHQGGFPIICESWALVVGLVASWRSSQRPCRGNCSHGKLTTPWRTKANGSLMSIQHGPSTRLHGQLSTKMKSHWRPGSRSWWTSWKRSSQPRPKRWKIVVRNTELHGKLSKGPQTQRHLNQPETPIFKRKFVQCNERRQKTQLFHMKGHQFAPAYTVDYWRVSNESNRLERQYSNGWTSPREWWSNCDL